ncbi:interphotoreceptor retinoid-binding protein [Streptomyces spiroverticillatus]|uniref:Interphotoreceptor retinoid-binding protein n=1 Tax=Streptomyces finlayi TaxID=67296 RepID=A0A918WZW9_9ACTN|nr:S41 family peptidase [Streptomyces finlayi]GHA16439.1 interphotoreceptor retinoid-binding protein [Streptomyces spiroverticillatus]GHC98664.1 interphotoreceptor retinoid-binding protein [Streptomyces finlayi]
MTTSSAAKTPPTPLLPASVAPVIDETVRLLTENYVFPDVAEQLAGLLRRRLADGAYDVEADGTGEPDCTDETAAAERLARLVTADLQSVNGDRHLRLKHHAEQVPQGRGEAVLASIRGDFESSLGGVPRVELLDGGVALLELGPMLFPLDWSAEALGAALTLVSRAQALVVDLRGNKGGDPDAVAFVCGHLLDERTHLNTMHWRGGTRIEQSWSPAHVPGPRFGGSKPLYVLTGADTFSAAEELAYDLQQLGRATVVGERTRGGAHPCEGWTVHPHLEVTVPFGRAVNPVSGTNWEGTGVQPDVPCAAPDALTHAHKLALAELAELAE